MPIDRAIPEPYLGYNSEKMVAAQKNVKNLRRLTSGKEKPTVEGPSVPRRGESPERKMQRVGTVVEDAPGKERPVVALKAPTGQEDVLSSLGPLVSGSARPKPYQPVLCTDKGRQLTNTD